MMAAEGPGYNRDVLGRWRWRGAAALVLVISCYLVLAAPAGADESIAVGPTPWLDVNLDSGTLTVKTWNRPQVQVSTDGRVDVRHVDAGDADPRIPRQYTAWSQTIGTSHGDVTMPEESFLLPALQGSSHDAVVARGQGNTTITVPRGTALVTAQVGTGQLNLRNYRGVFIAHVRDGGVSMNHVDGSGYVESLRGPVSASNSSFERLRVRTATGNMLFRGCTAHQIEATSNYGSIVYDNGRFQPGLAHFESVHGNVALGVRGGAKIGAHSGAGHIVSSFPNGAQLRGGHHTAQATVRGGGPEVTAVSKNGSVYIYNGSVRSHPRVQAELRGSQAVPGQGGGRRPAAAPAAGAFAPGQPPRYPARGYAQPVPQRYAPPQQRYPTPQYAPPQRNPGAGPPPRRSGPPPQRQQQQQQSDGHGQHGHKQPPL